MEDKPKIISEAKAFSRMSNLCARKECCAFDIRTKLQRLDLDTEVIDRIIKLLQKEKYIDELRFTKSFIHDKIRFNKWGKIKVEYALRQKRISENIVSEAFQDFSDEELTDSLPDLLKAKWKTIKGKSEYDKRNKLIRFGLGRGFEMRDIIAYIKKME